MDVERELGKKEFWFWDFSSFFFMIKVSSALPLFLVDLSSSLNLALMM